MNYLTLSKRIPSHEAAALVEHFTGHSQSWCLLNREAELPPTIDNALTQLESGIPLQYITGKAWFCGERYLVSPACLIPQPDTEHIVEIAARHLRPGMKLLDLCTGSGCIAIALLLRVPNTTAIAVDISDDALKIASQNAALHHMEARLTLRNADVLNDPHIPDLIAEADIITANPPYINSDVIDTLPTDVRHEPRLALDGGSDGMDFYRRFIEYARTLSHGVMVLEIGYDQADRIRALCEEAALSCRIHKDFGGNDRAAEIFSDKSSPSA